MQHRLFHIEINITASSYSIMSFGFSSRLFFNPFFFFIEPNKTFCSFISKNFKHFLVSSTAQHKSILQDSSLNAPIICKTAKVVFREKCVKLFSFSHACSEIFEPFYQQGTDWWFHSHVKICDYQLLKRHDFQTPPFIWFCKVNQNSVLELLKTDNERKMIPFMNNSAIFRHNNDAVMIHHIKDDCWKVHEDERGKTSVVEKGSNLCKVMQQWSKG